MAIVTNLFNFVAPGTINGSSLVDLSVAGGKIANDAIDANKIANSAVGNTEIANDAVDSSKIATESIVNSDISLTADISGSKLADNSIGDSKITALNGSKISAGTVSSSAIISLATNKLSVSALNATENTLVASSTSTGNSVIWDGPIYSWTTPVSRVLVTITGVANSTDFNISASAGLRLFLTDVSNGGVQYQITPLANTIYPHFSILLPVTTHLQLRLVIYGGATATWSAAKIAVKGIM